MLLTVLMVLGVLAVLFAAAAFATHDRDLLLDAPADRADVDLPVVGLQPEDISSVHLGMAVRGYRMSEVDDVLARVASELQSKDARILQLEQALIDVVEPQVTAAETFAEDPLVVDVSPPPDPPRWPEPELEPEPDPEPIVALDEPEAAEIETGETTETSDTETSESVPEPPHEALEVPQPAPPPPASGESGATSISVAHHAYVPVGHPDSHQPMPHPQPTEAVADPEPQPAGVPDWSEPFPQIPGGTDEESPRD